MKAKVGKAISLHAKHEVGNSGLSVPSRDDDEWCHYSRMQWRESVSTYSITHTHTNEFYRKDAVFLKLANKLKITLN